MREGASATTSLNGKKRVVILGGGFAGIEILKRLQKKFQNDDRIDITLVSKDTFLLFTPMLPEVLSGMVDARQITTPVRVFLKNNTFYQARVESIDLKSKIVKVAHPIGKDFEPFELREHIIEYDYLVIALGNKENFYGLQSVKPHAFTMSDVNDAITLRNHVISVLEQANLERSNSTMREKLLTFVIVGGGFNGIETAGELNDFVRDITKEYYKNISRQEIRVILVHSSDKILEQLEEELGKYALDNLKKRGVEFILNAKLKEAAESSVVLDNSTVIPCFTLIWSAGVRPSKLVARLECPHDDKHRIQVNPYLEVQNYEGAYTLLEIAPLCQCLTQMEPILLLLNTL
jgi:NADH dehydrogenase